LLSRLVIRQVTQEDLPALEWEGEYTHFRRLYAEAFRRAEMGDALLWVAELPRESLIGQVFIHLKSERLEQTNGQKRAYLYGFRVRPAYRNLGIGTLLLQTVEEDLVRRGYRYVNLNVGRDNPDARRLYERHGYTITGMDAGRWSYIDDQGRRREVHEPAWRMEKELRL